MSKKATFPPSEILTKTDNSLYTPIKTDHTKVGETFGPANAATIKNKAHRRLSKVTSNAQSTLNSDERNEVKDKNRIVNSLSSQNNETSKIDSKRHHYHGEYGVVGSSDND